MQFTLDSLSYSVPLFLKRQCDRTLGAAIRLFAAPPVGVVVQVIMFVATVIKLWKWWESLRAFI